jgi:hypothetical protein
MLLLDDGIWLVGFVELVLEVLEVLSGTRSELIPYVLNVSARSCRFHALCALSSQSSMKTPSFFPFFSF